MAGCICRAGCKLSHEGCLRGCRALRRRAGYGHVLNGVIHAPDLVAGAHADPLRDRAVLVQLLCELLLGEERLVGRPATERASAFRREQTAHGTRA